MCILCGNNFGSVFLSSLFKLKMDSFVKYVQFAVGLCLIKSFLMIHKSCSGFLYKASPNCMYLQSLSAEDDWTAYWCRNRYCFPKKTDLLPPHSFPQVFCLERAVCRGTLLYALCLISQDSSFEITFEILQKKAEGGAWKHHPHFNNRVCAAFCPFYSGSLNGFLNEGLTYSFYQSFRKMTRLWPPSRQFFSLISPQHFQVIWYLPSI